MPVLNAPAGPDFRKTHEALAEFAPFVPIGGHALRRDSDTNLMEDDLAVVPEVVPLLADNCELGGLREEQLPELVELGRGRVPPRKDAEIHPDLEPEGLLLDGEGDGILYLHYKSYCRWSES